MSAPGPQGGDWIKTWIDGQKAALEQWHKGQRTQPVPNGMGSFAELFAPATAQGQPLGAGGPGGQLAAIWERFGAAASGTAPTWDLPDVGPLREQQASLKELAEALADYQRFAVEMAGVLAKVHADTLDLLARRAMEQANAGKPVDSFRSLHDLWVECGEAIYSKVVHGESYCRLQANLCNAGIKVQLQRQQQVERWLKQLDLPTRSELNTLNRRVQELQRLVAPGHNNKAAVAATQAPKATRRAASGPVARAGTPRPGRKPRKKA